MNITNNFYSSWHDYYYIVIHRTEQGLKREREILQDDMTLHKEYDQGNLQLQQQRKFKASELSLTTLGHLR